MFCLNPNTNFCANPNPNPNPAVSDYYIQTCTILAGSCSGISTVSRVRDRVKVSVRVKGLKWYGCSVSAAQLVHAADECILCREG